MDYFKFDLQLFAASNVAVDLTTPTTGLESTQYLVGTTWYSSVAEIPEEDRGNILATLKNKVLTVAVGTEATGNSVTITAADAAALKGYTFKTVNSFSTTGSASTNKAAASTITIKDNAATPVTIYAGIGVTTGLSTSSAVTVVFDDTTAGRATISAGGSVGDMTAVASTGMSGAVFALDDTPADSTLYSGTATIAVGSTKVGKIGSNEYTNASETATATITAVDGASPTLTVGTVKVTTGAVTANGTTVTKTTNDVTVANTGLISGLADGSVFTVSDGSAGTTTYTVAMTYTGSDPTQPSTAATITASGNYSGVYELTLGKKAADYETGISVTPVAGKPDTISDNFITGTDKTVTPVAFNTAGLVVGVDGSDNLFNFYSVTYNSTTHKLDIAGVASAPTITGNVIGYFELTSGTAYGKTTVKLTYKNNATNPATVLGGNLAIDFTKLYTATGGVAAPTNIDVSGLTNGTVTVTGLAQSVTTVTGATPTQASFLEGQKLASGYTITLPSTMTADTYFYVTKSDSSDERNRYTYTVSEGKSAAPGTGTAYFLWTATSGALTYVANGGQPANLSADCWDGVTIDATKVTTPNVVLDVSDASVSAAKFAVSANVGFSVTSANTGGNVTATWAGDPTVNIIYAGGSAITMPTNANTPEYWNVTATTTADPKAGTNGNYEYTITKAGSAGANCFTVTKDAADKVTVSYSGTIKLSGLVTKKTTGSGTDPVTIAFNATGATAIDISDGDPGASTNVDYTVSNVTPGVSITGKRDADVIEYVETDKNAIAFKLADKAETGKIVYYAVNQAAVDKATGYKNITLGAKLTPTTPPPKGWNYVSIEEDKGVYTIKYVSSDGVTLLDPADAGATAPAKAAIDLTAVTVGQMDIDATGIASTATINVYTKDTVNDVDVKNAAAGITFDFKNSAGGSTPGSGTGDIVYDEIYVLDKTGASIALSDTTNRYWTITDTTTNGVHSLKIAAANAAPASGTAYFLVDATGDTNTKYTVTFDAHGSTTVSEETLATLADKIPVTAAGIPASYTKIDLSDTTVDSVAFAVTDMPSSVTTTNGTDNDTFDYGQTFRMSETANTLMLGAAPGEYYYAVTATGGNETKGIYTVTISDTPIDLSAAGDDPDKKAEILGTYGNYFKVVVEADKDVVFSYRAATGSKAIDLSKAGTIVNVDASSVDEKATVEVGKSGGEAVVHTYHVTGLVASNGEVKNTATGATALTYQYDETYAIGNTMAYHAALNTVGGKIYYKVNDRTGGDTASTTDKGKWTYSLGTVQTTTTPALGNHYFEITRTSEQALVITYHNTNGDAVYDLSKEGMEAVFSATGMPKEINTIDITDTATNAAVNYALTNVPATVTTVVGQTDKDTVTKAADAVLTATLTLTDAEQVYYVLSGTKGADGKYTCTLGDATTTKPAGTANYISVAKDSETGDFTIKYHPAVDSDTSFVLSSATSKLTIDAAAAAGATYKADGTPVAGAKIVIPETVVTPAVINAKGGVTVVKSDGSTLIDAGTVSYSTKFAWTPGLYYIAAKEIDGVDTFTVVTDAASTTKASDATTKYVKVTVKKDASGVYTATFDGKYYKTSDATGIFDGGTGVSASEEVDITLPATVTKFDAGSSVFNKIDGVVNGAVLTQINTATEVTTVSTLTSGQTVSINNTTFVSGGGAITVNGSKAALDGTFLLSVGDTALSGTATGTNLKTISITKPSGTGDGKVLVTFDGGIIKSIVGLQVGEQVTVTDGGSASYVYTTDGTRITKAPSAGTAEHAAATTGNILDQGYFTATDEAALANAGTFSWTVGTYYVKATGVSGTANVAYPGTAEGITSGSYYIKAVVKAGPVLELSTCRSNTAGLLDPVKDFTGTVNVAAAGTKVTYTKNSTDGFKVALTGVGAGSIIDGMNTATPTTADVTGDTIITATLAGGTNVKVDNITYGAAADGTVLTFTDGALTSGTFVAVNDAKIANGSLKPYVISGVSGSVHVAVETKDNKTSIKSITELGNAETITITAADGTVTKFVGKSATTVEKTVADASGNITKTTLTITAGADVWSAEGGDVTIQNDFDGWTKGKSAYFLFNSNGVATVLNGSGSEYNKNLGELTVGDYYVKATVTGVTDGVPTLTLQGYVVNADKQMVLADTGAMAGKKVDVTAPGTAMVYNGGSNGFSVAVTGAENGSVFTNLGTGDSVTTAALTTAQKVTVNTEEYVGNGGSYQIVAETATTSSLAGNSIAVTVTDSVEVISLDGTAKSTFTYTKGKAADNGVDVIFSDGEPTSIVGLENGSKVTIVTVTSSNTSTTTYEAMADPAGSGNSYIYRTVDGYTEYNTALIAEGADILDTPTTITYDGTATTSTRDAFAWTDSTTATSVTGYFLATDGAATAADQTAKVVTDYTQNGKTYLVVTYTKANGEVTLQKATVGANGALSSASALTGSGMKATLAITGGKAITYARPSGTADLASLTITGAGKGTNITGNWLADDHITTVATMAAGDTISLGGTTYTAGSAGALEVKGANLVNGTFRLSSTMASPVAKYTDSDDTVTQATITYTPTGTSTADVTVTNGAVTKITGLGINESIRVATMITDKLGHQYSEDFTYTTAAGTGAKEGQIVVTKTDNKTKLEYTHTFTSDAQDILDPSVNWVESGSASTSSFDWAANASNSTVGFFVATPTDTTNTKFKNITIAAQTTPLELTAGYYLKVTASKDTTGLVTITGMELVKRESTGLYSTVSGLVTTPIVVTTPASTNVDFKASVYPLAITAQKGQVYTNVSEDDTVKVSFSTTADTVTINGKTYTSGVSSATDIIIDGSGKVNTGTLTVGTTAAISDEAGSTVIATKGTAVVTFAPYDEEAGTGGITAVSLGETSESATITHADGQTITFTSSATDAKDITAVHVTTDGATEKWAKTLGSATANVYDRTGATPDNTFDFGKATGNVGYFDIDGSGNAGIAAGSDSSTALDGGKNYVRIVATTDEDGAITITSLKELQYNATSKSFDVKDFDGTVNIDSNKLGNVTLAADAIALPKDAKERNFTIEVTNAKAGGVFTGFGEKDQITGALTEGETLTISDGKTSTVWTAAKTTTATLNGDGTAFAGAFALTSGKSLKGSTPGFSTTLVTSIGSTAVQAVFAYGGVNEIYGLDAGESVVVEETTSGGVVTKTTYKAEAGSGGLVITRTSVVDGVTTTQQGIATDSSKDVINGVIYGPGTATIETQFNWTAEKGAGYFEVTPTIETGKVTKISDVTIAPQSKKSSLEKGKYYLKAALSADGDIRGITLVQVQDDGTLSTDLLQASTAGTITITAPTADKLSFFKGASTLGGTKIVVNGAIEDSSITGLDNGDEVTTATLAAPTKDSNGDPKYSSVTVNGETLKAGAAGPIKVVIDGGLEKLSAGTVAIPGIAKAGTKTINTTSGTVTFTQHNTAATTLDTPVVTVKNGHVTAVTGILTNGSTVAVDDSGVTQTYGFGSLLIAGIPTDGTLTTATLAADTAVTCSGLSFIMAEEGQAIIQNESTTPTLSSGTVKFTSGTSILLTGPTKATGDTKTLSIAIGTADDHAVKVKVQNGVVTSITGMQAGDSVTYDGAQYRADTATHIVKTDTATSKESNAYITAGGEVFTANYLGGDSEVDEENVLEGQLNWNDVSGRATGYFAIKENATTAVKTATIAEQATKTTVAIPKKGASAKYLIANVSGSVLTISGMAITTDANGKTTTDTLDTTAAANFASTDKITITAPTTLLTYDKAGAKFSVAINKLAAASVISNLATDDKVTTGALAEDDWVTVGGQTFRAGAKNATLTIVGETNTTAVLRTAGLYAGTIKMLSGESVVLAGTKDAKVAEGDDVTVTVANAGGDEVIVKTSNGAVTSVTGLETKDATVTVLGPTTAEVYTVLDTKGTMIRRQAFAVSGGAITGTALETGYKTITAGKEFYSANGKGYADAYQTPANTLTNWTDSGNKVAYIALTAAALDPDTGENKTLTSTAAKAARGGQQETDAFYATPESYYLRVTASTASNGVTTIKSVDLMQAGATGQLAVAKVDKTTGQPAYYGTLTIDGAGATSIANADDAQITYALPKTRTWNLAAIDVKVGSKFTNLGANDQVTSASITTATEFKAGTYMLYTANGTGTDQETVKIVGNGVMLTESAGKVDGLAGLFTKGETVTLIDETLAGGEVTTVYKVTAEGKVQRTVTQADGKQETKTIDGVTESYDVIADSAGKWAAATATGFQISSNFDWTTDGSLTTYAAVKSGTAAVKAGTVTINAKNNNAGGYVALAIAANGDVAANSVRMVTYDPTTGNINPAESAYAGKITIAAPTTALTFDRGTDCDATIDAVAQIVITGAAAGSAVSGLAAHGSYSKGDSVSTVSLKKGETVTVNAAGYTAVTGGKLTFTAQEVDGMDQLTLTGGTISLRSTNPEDDSDWKDTQGGGFAYVGSNKLITATKGGVNVNVSKVNSTGVATFTISDLGEGETFTVETVGASGQTAKYMKSGTTLFRTIEGQEGTYIYTIGKGTSVTSATLDKASNWKLAQDTFNTDLETNMKSLVSGGAVTVDLATLDKRITKDNNDVAGAGTGSTYDFVVDTYLASPLKKKADLAASVINDLNLLDVQTTVGKRLWDDDGDTIADYVYRATANIAQSIKAYNGWTVNGSDGDDKITGAAKGFDTLAGGLGNDSLVGGAATDEFRVGTGRDTVKGYATKVDSVVLTGAYGVTADNVSLTGSDVLIHSNVDADNDGVMDDSVLLVGMGNGKAVEIGGLKYYFGNGKAKANTAASFAYDFVTVDPDTGAGSYYFANKALKNTLTVSTNSKEFATAKTLGDTVEIDLNAESILGSKYYNNIAAIDASKSGNRVKLTALAEANTTLKGGTYQSTLIGGSGNDSLYGGSGADVFWFENLAGNDTVTSYAATKDAIYLGDWDGDSAAANVANGVTVQGASNNKDVILTNGSDTVTITSALGAAKAVRISKDGTSTNTLSYYVGAAGTSKKQGANSFTAKNGTDMTVTTTTTGEPAVTTTTVTTSSYYIGSDSAVDTLKLAGKNSKETLGTANAYAQFVMEGAHFQSIDVLDASGIAAGSFVELVGKSSGSFTLKGSTSTKTQETFNLKGLTTDSVKATIQNLSVSDVVELGAGMKLTQTSSASATNTVYLVTDAGGTSYGTLQINGVKAANLSYNSTTNKLTRTK